MGGVYIAVLLPKKQNKKNYKSLSGIYLKSRHESPANSSDKSESVNCAKALQYAILPGSLTVEAAFVAPWIILAAIVLCSLFSVLRGELYMSAALHNAARIMAAEVTEIEHKENISDDVPADTNIVSHIRLRYLVQKELHGGARSFPVSAMRRSLRSMRGSSFMMHGRTTCRPSATCGRCSRSANGGGR